MKKSEENLNEWDSAINDALDRMQRLRKAVKLFRRMRDAGGTWPGYSVREVETGEKENPATMDGGSVHFPD